MNLIKLLFLSVCRICFWVGLICLSVPFLSANVYSPILGMDKPIRKSQRAVRALKDPWMSKYCSSVSVRYKGKSYTLTNRHCCRANDLFQSKYRFVGSSIETILFESQENDVCVMTSQAKAHVKLAKKPAKSFEKVLILGYPRGQLLTPRFGHVLARSKKICLEYESGKKCEKAIVSSNLIYPGNSGSPLLNMDGELVGLAYGGNWSISYAISVKLENVKKALEHVSKENK